MSKKIDERLPQDFALKYWPGYAAIKSPWDKLMNFKDVCHYIIRFDSVLGAVIMQAYRMALPDYQTRTEDMCRTFERVLGSYKHLKNADGLPVLTDAANVHPFFCGNFMGALRADYGDEYNLMCGRVNDFGTYRVEKELDVCDWDIVGSELCRSTIWGLQAGMCDTAATLRPDGPLLEFNMVEAKGCGDRHCRVVAECRKKWPMPEKHFTDHLGPIATDDQIKYTPEEECLKEPQIFRQECNYTYASGTNFEIDVSQALIGLRTPVACINLYPAILTSIREGHMSEESFDHAIKCVCEAAGKAAFGEFFAKEGLRSWLGVPNDVPNDARVLGGYIEMYLQGRMTQYEIEAFNKDEAIYVIDRAGLEARQAKYVDALLAYWYGMSKTLLSAEWAAWEEDSPEGKVRFKIAKKKDRYC